MLNIRNLTTGLNMLHSDVDTWIDAYYWLDHCRQTYGPDTNLSYLGLEKCEFVIVHRCDCGVCDIYYTIH